MGKTSIEWADTTENFVAGCSKASAACDNCYALGMSHRLASIASAPARYEGTTRRGPQGLEWTGEIAVDREAMIACFERYRRRRKPARVFLGSMTDLFHARVPVDFLFEMLDLIEGSPRHAWLLLTKRPSRMARVITAWMAERGRAQPLPNLWTGATVESQRQADVRILALVSTPSVCRFISCEPLVGPLDLMWPESLYPNGPPMCCGGHMCGCLGMPTEPPMLFDIHWVIAGGESGARARPSHPGWFRDLRDQCSQTRTAFLFKQFGEYGIAEPPFEREAWVCYLEPDEYGHAGPDFGMLTEDRPHEWVARIGKKEAGRHLDGRTHDDLPACWPPALDDADGRLDSPEELHRNEH